MNASLVAPTNTTATPERPAVLDTTSGTHSGTTHANTNVAMPLELEQTLSLLSTHRSVLGYLLLSRGDHVSIIRHSGVVFEGEQGKRYAGAIRRIIESVQTELEEVSGEDDGDRVRFMRIRTRRHELMISPDDRFLLAVLQDPAT